MPLWVGAGFRVQKLQIPLEFASFKGRPKRLKLRSRYPPPVKIPHPYNALRGGTACDFI